MYKQLVNLAKLFAFTASASQALAKPVSSGHGHTKFDWRKNEIIFAFGDSYTYTQGQYGLTNYSWNAFQTLDKHGQVIVAEDPIILNAVSKAIQLYWQ
jgi:hypothetical protein